MPEKRVPVLDITKIILPTDRVTLGQMRRREPRLFDSSNTSMYRAENAFAIVAFQLEQSLAEKAFAKELKIPEGDSYFDRRRLISLVDDAYRKLGLSTGKHESQEMIKSFEDAARQQARELSGPGRK